MITPCVAEPGHWQNHVHYTLALNASSLLMLILLATFSNVKHLLSKKISADYIVVTEELVYKHCLWNSLHVSRPTLQDVILYS